MFPIGLLVEASPHGLDHQCFLLVKDWRPDPFLVWAVTPFSIVSFSQLEEPISPQMSYQAPYQ